MCTHRHRIRSLIPTVLFAACTGSPMVTHPTDSDGIDCDQDFGDPAVAAFVLPFPVGRTYRLIQGYCVPDPTWGHHDWLAYDFDLATGDTVVASQAGRVWFLRENQPDVGGDCSGGKENMVIVLHQDGTAMNYVHLTTAGALVSVGEHVARGQPIALSGNSGCSSGPHLHVALFPDSTDFSNVSSLPFNYRNAEGPLDENRGLVQGALYTALTSGTGG